VEAVYHHPLSSVGNSPVKPEKRVVKIMRIKKPSTVKI